MMASLIQDRPRQVIPRWRSFSAAHHAGETVGPVSSKAPPVDQTGLDLLVDDWEREQSLGTAADLVSAAVTLARVDIARTAADFVMRHDAAPPTLRNLAQASLAGSFVAPAPPPPLVFAKEGVYGLIHQHRAALDAYPGNPILWADLGQLFLSIGQPRKAERALLAALTLAPANRIVLRAAARLFLHIGDGERAHALLARAPSVRRDPWVLSAEIATAAAIGHLSRLVKVGQALFESGHWSGLQLSELFSAVGTLEAQAGNSKMARKLIRLSVEHGTENSIAQAAWVRRNVTNVAVELPVNSRSAEANSWTALAAGRWSDVVREARRWQMDEPFSSRPAIVGSFVAVQALSAYAESIRFAEQGLLTNPDDHMLRNNLAYALILDGQLENAAELLSHIVASHLDPLQRLVNAATAGLLAIRKGDLTRGRQLYAGSIDGFNLLKNHELSSVAELNLAFEEVRLQTPESAPLAQKALRAADGQTTLAVTLTAARLRTALADVPVPQLVE